LTKEPKPTNGRKIAFSTNGVGSSGGQHVEECKLIHSYHKAKVQVDQEPPHTTYHIPHTTHSLSPSLPPSLPPSFKYRLCFQKTLVKLFYFGK